MYFLLDINGIYDINQYQSSSRNILKIYNFTDHSIWTLF